MGKQCYHVVRAGSEEPISLPPSQKEDICNKCREAGYTPEIPNIPPYSPLQVRKNVSSFCNHLARDYLSETPLFVVHDADGRAVAFANEIPSYRKGESTIDLMRHRLETPNGTMDYLLTESMLILREVGYRQFDLGLAPLAGVGDRPGATLQERALSQLSERLTRFFSYKGLRFYKAKFEPDWEDRYLVYGVGPLALARVGVALTRVTEG
jgi:lysylphosphatidylglycerol synthetase-like protein (DUF2156 family)